MLTWQEFMLHEKQCMCTHVDIRTECCHHGWYFKGKGLWSLRGKLNSCIPDEPCFAPHWQAVHLTGALHLIEFLLFRRIRSVSWFHLNLLRLKLHPVRHTIFGPVMHLSAPAAFPLEHLQQACTSAEGMTQGKPTVLLFTFHPYSPLTHGCYRSELSTNQLSAHICPMSTVCLLFSALVSERRKGWTLWGLNQAVISRTDCLFFHCLCPSDKQAWVLTYDPFY